LIKRGVYRECRDIANVSFPIVHPFEDASVGFARIKSLHQRLSPLNMFSEFKSEIYTNNVENFHWRSLVKSHSQVHDVYHLRRSLSDFFYCESKPTIKFISVLFLRLCKLLSFSRNVRLAVNGRSSKLAKIL